MSSSFSTQEMAHRAVPCRQPISRITRTSSRGSIARSSASVRDDCLKHAEFRDEHGISVCLLSDEDGMACRQYGVWQEREVNGVRKSGIVRSTFIIDKQGVLRLAEYGVNAKGHALAMLRAVKELNS
jgi:peroxiredoxin